MGDINFKNSSHPDQDYQGLPIWKSFFHFKDLFLFYRIKILCTGVINYDVENSSLYKQYGYRSELFDRPLGCRVYDSESRAYGERQGS